MRDDSSLPSTLGGGRYVVGRLLGEGATKRVYAGRDQRLDRDVAIAALRPEELDSAGTPRLRREAQAMARLDEHPNVVRVYDVFEEGGGVYIVTQLMAGGELAWRMRNAPHGRLAVADAIAIAGQIGRALEHAHRHGIAHRDVKPGNVWLAEDGTAKLGDFGLAVAGDRSRITAEGLVLGTVAYMAPEQFVGRTIDIRSDIYALGATLYEMLTGRPPFVGDDMVAVISQHVHTRPVAPSCHNAEVPAGLDQLVLELLAKDPGARPASATIVCGRLAALATFAASPTPVPRGANPLDRLASGIFVGRSAELDRLRGAFEDALLGRSRVVLLAGEPGIGKTRTAEELETYAGLRGALTLWGRSWEGQGAPPFWPWIQILRAYLHQHEPREVLADLGIGAGDVAQLVPELRELLPGLPPPPAWFDHQQARFRLFDAVVTLLRNASRRRPLLVVLDDLNWADEASLLLLQFLIGELGAARLLVVGTYRDVELSRRHPLAETLAELARHQSDYRVRLGGLTPEEIGRFLEQTTGAEAPAGLVRAVFDRTEGNAFFVHEVVRLLAAEGRLSESPDPRAWSLEIPPGVREVVGRRLNRLSEACNDALAVASVLGREFDLDVLSRVSGTPEAKLLETLDDAIAARLLLEGPGLRARYRFAHALVRETLYDELPALHRMRLHRQAGEALEQVHDGGGARLADIAHHLWQSARVGDAERALAACLRAAEWARSSQAWEDAALHLERALQVMEEIEGLPEVDRRCELVVELAEMQALGADREKSRETALLGAELARQTRSPSRFTRAVLAYGGPSNFIEGGRVDATMVTLLEEALAELGDGDSRLRAKVLQRLAQELTFSADSTRIAALLEEAMALAESVGDPALEAAASLALQFGFRIGGEDLALEESRRLATLARQGGDPTTEQRAWSQAVTGAIWLGRIEEARQAIDEERRLAEELRTPFARYLPLRHDAMLAMLEGRFAEASSILLRCDEIGRSALGGSNLKQWNGAARYVMGRHLGSPRGRLPSRPLAGRFSYPLHRAFRAGIHLSAGQRDEARQALDLLAADDFTLLPRDTGWLATLMLAADLACELGVTSHAAPLYDLLLPYRGRWPTVGLAIACLGAVDLAVGRLALLLDRHREAEAHLRDAITMAESIGARPYLAEAHSALGAVLLACGPGDRGP